MLRHATTPFELTIPSPPAHAMSTPRGQMLALRSVSKWRVRTLAWSPKLPWKTKMPSWVSTWAPTAM